jgi:hypothetical protein
MKFPPIETGCRCLTSIGAGAAATNGVALKDSSEAQSKGSRRDRSASGSLHDARRATSEFLPIRILRSNEPAFIDRRGLLSAGGHRHRAKYDPCRRHSFAPSRLGSPELCFVSYTLLRQRAQGRPGAGWHPRSTVRRLRYKRLHSGIQVKPNTRPSLRSGLTAYAEFSPGSDALLPPSPCGWLMRNARSGWPHHHKT